MSDLDDVYAEKLSLLERRIAALEQKDASAAPPKSRAIEMGLVFAMISVAIVFGFSLME